MDFVPWLKPMSTNNNSESSSQQTSYPTSSKKKINWDKLQKDIALEEEEEIKKSGGDAALNAFFSNLYANASDETKRAMNKSFTESNGTALSTNWADVSKKKVESVPPSGLEAKKWNDA